MALEERERLLEEMTMEKQRLMQAFTVMLSKEVWLIFMCIYTYICIHARVAIAKNEPRLMRMLTFKEVCLDFVCMYNIKVGLVQMLTVVMSKEGYSL